ncbi:virion structural protein [Pseudomonas phage Noxifer]|uniref:Virion structural protein n=1 Tax=Pseudomonas phage Noxifer TaxID=2006684 RepID=A0A1Y0SXP6_9CAUD|nr:virion structural protein [Pseudomonas phage Noxifer]ARV77394.1 hypothetical protein NOXIFER_229 [Pseudomonas phage Noxifer]
MADKVVPSLPGGYYVSERTVSWSFDPSVTGVAYSLNGLPPSISEYIAYDTLVPPNPFIAVTQDGKGRVVYDGGFPKFYNTQAPAPGTPFASLSASFKYLYNAINWTADPMKVAAGNKKILILGDVPAPSNYAVKDVGANGFFTSFTNLCQSVGFTPTFKDTSDYGGYLNATLSEMSNYACILVMGAIGGGDPKITNNCVTDMTSFRASGGGIILITDDGPDIPNIGAAYPPPQVSRQFFVTVNKIAVQFGAYFTGLYDRTPVNVGFLRANYGDHPLYAGMDNSESINAGGSESKVIVTTTTLVAPGTIGPITFPVGTSNKIHWLVKTSDGSIYTYSFVYNIDTGEIILFKDANGNEISQIDIGWDYLAKPRVDLSGTGLGTLQGSIYKGGVKVGETYYDETNGTKQIWFAGVGVPVVNGDVIQATVDVPFTYSRNMTINRKSAPIKPMTGKAKIAQALHKLVPTELRQRAVEKVFAAIQPFYPVAYKLGGAQNIQVLRDYLAGVVPLTDVTINAYDVTAALNAALAVPPSGSAANKDMILDMANNRVYRYLGGNWAQVPGVTNQQIFGAPRVIQTQSGGKRWRLNTDGSISVL